MTQKSYITEAGEALEADEEFFGRAVRGRPEMLLERRKKSVTLRLDPAIIDHFKKDGKGWQTRINAALRKAAGLESTA